MNSVVHFELPAKDLERSREFYKTVFGWDFYEFDEKNLMVSTTKTDDRGMPLEPGAINGSIYVPEKPKTPTIVINVPDIKAHIELVIKSGGKLIDEIATVPDVGMYARFEDTEGNLVGLWQSFS
jgi:uncharacterized protein